MRVDIDIQGINAAIKDIKRWEHTKNQAVKNAINESALNIQKGAKRRCPVDTGRLRSSIAMQPYNEGFTMRVGTKVHYAPYVEFGTGKFVDVPAGVDVPTTGRQTPWRYPESRGGVETGEMIWTSGNKPQPFLFPASEEEKPKLVRALREALAK
jgi:HK97 gp10 family phage protein